MQEGLKLSMFCVMILSMMILSGIFVTDWFFIGEDGALLNDTIVGVLIGAPIGWFGSIISFYTSEKIKEAKKVKDNGNPND